MKVIVAVILAFMLLSGCNGTQDSSSKQSSSQKEQTVIRIAAAQDADKLSKLAKIYENADSHIKLSVLDINPDADFVLVAKALVSGENSPTVFLLGAEHFSALAEYFADLSGESWVNNAVANSLSEVSDKGKVLAMPAQIEGIGFVYRSDVFKAAKINPENINSFERLRETAEYLDGKIKNGDFKEQFPELIGVFNLKKNIDSLTQRYLPDIALSQQFDKSQKLLEETVLEQKNWDSLKELIDVQKEFSGGESVVTLDSHKTADGSLENLGILPIPVKNASQDSIILNVPSYWAVNKNADKNAVDGAKKFLSWLYTSEEGKSFVSNEMNWLAPFDGFSSPLPDNPLAERVKVFADSGKTMPFVLNQIPDSLQESLKENLTKYLKDELDFTEAVKNIAQDFEKSANLKQENGK